MDRLSFSLRLSVLYPYMSLTTVLLEKQTRAALNSKPVVLQHPHLHPTGHRTLTISQPQLSHSLLTLRVILQIPRKIIITLTSKGKKENLIDNDSVILTFPLY